MIDFLFANIFFFIYIRLKVVPKYLLKCSIGAFVTFRKIVETNYHGAITI